MNTQEKITMIKINDFAEDLSIINGSEKKC
jgi:hypothetical protein